ncbi:zinc knuckle domain containing protein [Nitzschia inconspicua]|uniref:Zinc knuckle domain containing protein n=1 Tax=Nitzschia inconspicua TaxID=303405 RepID=A0A9K3LAD0_9STRA|nr:zinc knuckle domain containing protein [Nitzschia inconspicua]
MTEKNIKIIKFQGTKEHYPVWAFQMEAYLEELEILDALKITSTGNAVTDEERKMNRKAYLKLALSCDDAEYEHVADNLARDPNKTITSVTNELKEKFERMKISGTVDDSEKALTGFKKFSGNCNYCGKQGHKSAQCFKKQQAEKSKDNKSGNGNGKFQGTCHHCGKKGHKKNDCFKLKNESKKDKVEDSGAVVLMAEDYYADGFFDDLHTGPNERLSDKKNKPILTLDHEESLGSYDEPCEKKRWWADCCESSVSSTDSGPIFLLEDDELNIKESLDIDECDDDDDDCIPDLVSRAEVSEATEESDDDSLFLVLGDKDDDEDIVMTIPRNTTEKEWHIVTK